MNAPAYDYTAQRWVDGPAADRLRLAQLRQEAELLSGPAAASYAAFINLPDLPAALAEVLAEIATLEDTDA
jgi:hypothetical protein